MSIFFRFHKLLKTEPFVNVHIDNLAAQTGVTRFTQINNDWSYSKNESLQPHELQEYTHLLIEAKSKYSPNLKAFSNSHIILDSIESFSQISINYKLIPPVKIKTKPSIFILERKDFRDFPHGHEIIRSASSEEYIDSSESADKSAMDTESREVEFTKIDVPEEVPPIVETEDVKIHESTEEIKLDDAINEDIEIAKKAFDDLKHLRQERKQRAIAKIKTETRKEVVASAKEKLKEIMKRHQHIAEELSETLISDMETVTIEENEGNLESDVEEVTNIELENNTEQSDLKAEDEEVEIDITVNRTDENVNAIVEEVITRLIDRKIYDHKTKPEDIKAEDREIIQKIVEEVLSERMNYTGSNTM